MILGMLILSILNVHPAHAHMLTMYEHISEGNTNNNMFNVRDVNIV